LFDRPNPQWAVVPMEEEEEEEYVYISYFTGIPFSGPQVIYKHHH